MPMRPFDLLGIGTVFAQVYRIGTGIQATALKEVYVRIGKTGTQVFTGTVDNGSAFRNWFDILILIHLDDLSVNNQNGIPGQYLFLLHINDIGVFDEELGRELMEKEQGGGQEEEAHGFCFFKDTMKPRTKIPRSQEAKE